MSKSQLSDENRLNNLVSLFYVFNLFAYGILGQFGSLSKLFNFTSLMLSTNSNLHYCIPVLRCCLSLDQCFKKEQLGKQCKKI